MLSRKSVSKNNLFKAVILAAGRGKRMRSLTDETPKPLLSVGGRTFLDHIFDALTDAIREVIVVVGYQGDKIKNYLGDNYKGRAVRYVVQEKLDGTGRAVLLARPFFAEGERFLIFYADEIIGRADVEKCLEHEYSWLCWEVEKPEASGIITLSLEGLITEVVEKPRRPKSRMAGAGLMLVNADIFQYEPAEHETGEYYLTSMMNQFVKDHRVRAVIGSNRLSFSSPEDITRCLQFYA